MEKLRIITLDTPIEKYACYSALLDNSFVKLNKVLIYDDNEKLKEAHMKIYNPRGTFCDAFEDLIYFREQVYHLEKLIGKSNFDKEIKDYVQKNC